MRQKSLQQLFDEFIYESQYLRKVRPDTIRGYNGSFLLLTRIIPDISLQNLDSTTVSRFFEILQNRKRYVGKGTLKQGIKKSTTASYWNKLNAFFKWLVAKNYLEKNPFHGLRCPTPCYDDKKFLKREEIEKIISAIHLYHSSNLLVLKRNLVIFYTLLFCGLRKEEMLLLQIKDIDFLNRTLEVRGENSKSGRNRLLPLHPKLAMYLKDYLAIRKNYTTPYLIVSNKGDSRLTNNGLKHVVERLKNHSEVDFHIHQLRHTFAVNFLKHSNNIAKLRQLLGHKSLLMTLTYLRCLPISELQSDVEAMRIDRFI